MKKNYSSKKTRFIGMGVLVSLLMSCFLWTGMPIKGNAESNQVSTENQSVAQKVDAVMNQKLADFSVVDPLVGTTGGDWTIMNLCRSGFATDELLDRYAKVAADTMQSVNGSLSRNKYTEYSRLILGLTAAGKDVTNVGGYDLLTYLTDFNKVKKQGLNGPIWALIALDCHNYPMPEPSSEVAEENINSRQRMVDYILSLQKNDGGWSLTSDPTEASDPDMTGMAMVALDNYTVPGEYVSQETAEEVQVALDAAIECLADLQSENGEFGSYGAINVESTTWAAMALMDYGIDPTEDERFIKNGMNLIDCIESYYIEDDTYGPGFAHIKGDGWNDMATDQASYGLIEYLRFKDGGNDFFDMQDVEIQASQESGEKDPPKEKEEDPSKGKEEQPKETEKKQETKGIGNESTVTSKKTTSVVTKTTPSLKSSSTGTSDGDLVLGVSDIGMVNITGKGNVLPVSPEQKSAFERASEIAKTSAPPFLVGCLFVGAIWGISAIVKNISKKRRIKKVNSHIKERNDSSKGE